MTPVGLSDKPARTLTSSRPGWLATVVPTLLVFVAALVSRTGMLGLPPIYDELYHLLPAMSLQDTGTFAVLDGAYERASIFTRLVALGFDLAGERSTAAARFLPSALPGALLVAVMFLWTRLVAGWFAAGVVAVFLLFWPNGIEVSQYVRFYALQGLVFVLAALAIYTAMTADVSVKAQAALFAVAGLLLLFALDLQLMTLVGAAAIGLWVAALYGPGWLRRYVWVRWAVAGGLALVLLVLASGVFDETLAHLWTTYRWEPWPATNDTTFYHRDFRDNYPTFWPLFPFAALIALRARFVPASFCLALFALTFVVQSFGGLKNIRYLYPTMPFFFVIWGIALSATATALLRYFRDIAEGALAPVVWPALRGIAAAAVLVVSGLFVVAANAAFERSVTHDRRQRDRVPARQAAMGMGRRARHGRTVARRRGGGDHHRGNDDGLVARRLRPRVQQAALFGDALFARDRTRSPSPRTSAPAAQSPGRSRTSGR